MGASDPASSRPAAHVVAEILSMETRKMSKGFLDRLPSGPVRNITPNGTTRDSGDQPQGSNGYTGRGKLGTGSTSENLGSGPSNTNRSGEGKGY